MADAIRDVLIRGKFEIATPSLPVPDITAFTKQLEEQNVFARQQAELIDEIVKRQEARDDASAKAAEVGKKNRADAAAARAVEKQAEKERADADAAAAKAEKEKQEAIDKTNRERDAAIAKDRQINDALLKTADSLKLGGEGAFAFARGLTLIGLEGSSSFEEVARQVASVQAKFDLFKGSVDILKSGVEATRSLTLAITAAGGAVQLFQLKMASLVASLGPTGLIVAGVSVATAALVGLWQYLTSETDEFVERSQEALDEFVAASEQAAFEAQAAFTKQDAIRATLEGNEKIASIQTDLSGVGETQTAAEILKDEFSKFEKSNAALLTDEQRAAQEKVIGAETLAAFTEAIEEQNRRVDLNKELLGATTNRDQGGDRERENAIQKAENAEKQTQQAIQKAQADLRVAEEAAAEKDRQIAIERASLSGSDREFVQRVSGSLGDANTNIENIQRLGSLAPAQFGEDVRDELTRRGGGTPAVRVDQEEKLAAELASLTAALKAQQTTTSGLRSADSAADAEALAAAESIRKLLRGLAVEVESLTVERKQAETFYEQAQAE